MGRQNYFDARIIVYHFVIKMVVVAFVAVIIKIFLLDTVKINTNQMTPSIENGDRIIMSRLAFVAPFSWVIKHKRMIPVVFRYPFSSAYGCLRIVALPSDTISIDSGRLNLHNLQRTLAVLPPNETILPQEYLPRDFMPAFCIPAKGDTINLAKCSKRDFFFYVSMIRQENPTVNYMVFPSLIINGKKIDNFQLTDFSLFKGSLDSVTADKMFDWYFWEKLLQYLNYTLARQPFELIFELRHNDKVIYNYKLKSDFVFLIADNWVGGNDSRYFGPIKRSLVRGRVLAVLWAFSPQDGTIIPQLRWSRIGKLVR